MQRPIEVDLAHQLGKDEARSRIANNIGTIPEHMPGGVAEVTSRWEGDSLYLTIEAMGQEVPARIDVQEANVHLKVELPGFLALMAGPIEAFFNKKGKELLLEDKSKK